MKNTDIQKMWDELNKEIIRCQKCPRLVAWREEMAFIKRKAYRDQEYWGKPVPGFGDKEAQVLVVGLAPGAHGSNRTGRMFTGDASGEFLCSSLFKAGFTNQKKAEDRHDGLQLDGLFITALCRCAPPGNKPTKEEIYTCLPFLEKEIDLQSKLMGYVTLGQLAFQSLLKIYKKKYQIKVNKEANFAHGKLINYGGKIPWILASYHPSRQNTQTGRLTQKMFDDIWFNVKKMVLTWPI